MEVSIVSDGTPEGTLVSLDGRAVDASAVSFAITFSEDAFEKTYRAEIRLPAPEPAVAPSSIPAEPAPSWGARPAPIGDDSPPTTRSPGVLKTEDA